MSTFDRQRITQYMNIIKQADFEYSKDNLGYYFDNGLKKFSIMKSGPLFSCFYNKKSDAGWILKAKQMGILDFGEGLHWIILQIQKGD